MELLVGVVVVGAIAYVVSFVGKAWSVNCLDQTFKDRIEPPK